MKQDLIVYKDSDDLSQIPQNLFDGNTIIIKYVTFYNALIKYIFIDRVFLIPCHIYNEIVDTFYTIENNAITYDNNILRNDCTINGENYLPYDNFKIKEYHYHFKNEVGIVKPFKCLQDTLKLSEIKIKPFNNSNIYTRLIRYIQFGNEKIGKDLMDLFENNRDKFLETSTASFITNDFENMTHDIKIKLDDDIYIYDFYGGGSYIDTFTKYYFYHDKNIKDDLLFWKEFKKHPVQVCFYSILNWQLARNIHRITNTHLETYNKMLEYLKENICQNQ